MKLKFSEDTAAQLLIKLKEANKSAARIEIQGYS